MNFKYTISLSALIALTGTSCQGAASQELSERDQNTRLVNLLSDNNNNPQEAFFYAIKNNLIWAIDGLSHYDINLEAQDRNRQTPLERAALHGYETMVAKLLAIGAISSREALMTAVLRDRVGVIKQLAEAGAPASAISSALEVAQRRNQSEIVEILLGAQRTAREQQARAAEAERAAAAAEIERVAMDAEIERAVTEARRSRDAEAVRAATEARRSRAAAIAAAIVAGEQPTMPERIAQNREESTHPRYPRQATHDANAVQNMEETVSIPRYTKYTVGDRVRTLINGTSKIGIVTSVNFVVGVGDQYRVTFEIGENEISPA